MACKKEVSGFLCSAERFASHMLELAAPGCSTTSVRLYHNEPKHTAALISALSTNTSVTSLDIYELEAASATSLAALLSTSHHLSSLTIQHIHNTATMEALAPGLKCSPALTSLTLHSLDTAALCVVAGALAACPHAPQLQSLLLPRCRAGGNAASAIAAACSSHGAVLKDLQLAADDALLLHLGGDGSQQRLQLPALETLELSGGRASPAGAAALGRCLAGCLRLHRLTLAHVRLGEEGSVALALALASSAPPSLSTLVVRSAAIGDAGADALATTLKCLPSLHTLDLNDNAVGAAGCSALIAVARYSPLQHLHLDSNAVKGTDLQAVAATAAVVPMDAEDAAMADRTGAGPFSVATAAATTACCSFYGPGLQSLHLTSNALTDVGVGAVLALLSDSPGLVHLNLCSTGFGDAGAELLVTFLQSRPHLRVLLLDNNRLGNRGGTALLDAGSSHPGLRTFRADGSKVTLTGLRQSLTELTQLLAAKACQESAAHVAQAAAHGQSSPRSADSNLSSHCDSDHTMRDAFSNSSRGSDLRHIHVTSSAEAMKAFPRRVSEDSSSSEPCHTTMVTSGGGTPMSQSGAAGATRVPIKLMTASSAPASALHAIIAPLRGRCGKPRFKPLTAAEQALFEDF